MPWSTWTRRSLVEEYGVDPQRVEVVPPGIDLERWAPGERREGPPRILFVGGDLYRKGGATLLVQQLTRRLVDSALDTCTASAGPGNGE